MQNNRILAVAIASTLCSGVAYGSFENARDGMTPAALDTVYTPRRPVKAFDFEAFTLIRVNDVSGTYGTVYASELFGDARTLPSGDTSRGTYAAVVYSIDGAISDDFEMTFTLTNGATFDGDPWLGIDDSGIGSTGQDANVTAKFSENTSNVTLTDGSLTATDIFKFSTHGTLYKVQTNSGNEIQFYQLGTTGDTAKGLSEEVDGSSLAVGLYKYSGNALEMSDANVINTSIATADNIAVWANDAAVAGNNLPNMANIATGMDNIIVNLHYYLGTQTTENCYEVTGKVGGNIVLGSNLPAHGNNATLQSNAITRCYQAGDTKLHVGNALAFQVDHIYQFESDTALYKVSSPDTTTGNNIITVQNMDSSKTGLSSAIPAGTTKAYRVDAFGTSSGGEGWTLSNGTLAASITLATTHTPALPLKAKTGTGSGKSTATFLIPASKDPLLHLKTSDRLMLLYKLGNTKALGSPGQKINMTVALATALTNIKVNPAREITVASSKPGIKLLDMKPLEGGEIKISVLSDSKEFTGDGAPFIGTNEAKIGYINLDNDDSDSQEVKAADGETKFEVGKTGALADKSTLQITDGQFAASLKTPGTVLVQAGSTNLQADTVTETDATWNLHDTGLIAIEAAILDKTAIHFKVDGSTGINVPENNPHATLTIDFDDTKMTDLTIEADLRKIKKDGTICHIYNVPNATAADALSIRITNDSAVAGKLTVALYNMDGTEAIAAGTELFEGEEIKPDETKRLSAADLELLAGAAWSGRARAVISSTLPKLAILALLRQNVPGGALVNMSVGATGNSCNSD